MSWLVFGTLGAVLIAEMFYLYKQEVEIDEQEEECACKCKHCHCHEEEIEVVDSLDNKDNK